MSLFLVSLIGLGMGIFSGLLPGIGTASILLTFYTIIIHFSPLELMVLYISLIISSQYVATLTAIYTGIPGAESAFPTAKESSNLIRMGITREAVAQNAIASLVGNSVGLILFFILMPVAMYAYSIFGAAVQMSIILTSIILVVSTSDKRWLALISIIMAFAMSSIGQSPHTYAVYNFGFDFLTDRLSWVAMTMGAIIGYSISSIMDYKHTDIPNSKPLSVYSGFTTMKGKYGATLRGSFIGFFVGLVPGLSYILSSTVAYQIEKKITRNDPSKSDGILKSLISSDAAHCSGTIAMLIPLLAFGIPITASEGVIFNIITLHSTTSDVLASLIKSIVYVMFIVLFINLISMVFAWKLGNVLVRVFSIPKHLLMFLIIALSLVSVVYISMMNGQIILPIAVYFIVGIIHFLLRMNPLPFIFGVLVFNVFETLTYSLYQLYFI